MYTYGAIIVDVSSNISGAWNSKSLGLLLEFLPGIDNVHRSMQIHICCSLGAAGEWAGAQPRRPKI